jgi:hypothetical protein
MEAFLLAMRHAMMKWKRRRPRTCVGKKVGSLYEKPSIEEPTALRTPFEAFWCEIELDYPEKR